MSDLLDTPIGDVDDPVPMAWHYEGRFPRGKIFDGFGFFNWLNMAEGTHLWVMTYTASYACPLETPVERLILSIGDFEFETAKYYKNVHTKLYLQFKKKRLVGVYIGSQNLVAPTSANLMVRLPQSANDFAKKYFLHYWNQ